VEWCLFIFLTLRELLYVMDLHEELWRNSISQRDENDSVCYRGLLLNECCQYEGNLDDLVMRKVDRNKNRNN